MRPTAAERLAAERAMKKMVEARIVKKQATRTERAMIACAMALHCGEEFGSDNDAKRAFGVSLTTDVRQRWVPRLKKLAVWTSLPQPRSRTWLAEDVPTSARRKFCCGHRPMCASKHAHEKLLTSNWAGRVNRKRGKRQLQSAVLLQDVAEEASNEVDAAAAPSESRPHRGLQQRQMPDVPAPRLGQCEGFKRDGTRCKVARTDRHRSARTLREGSAFCVHHQPDKFTGTQCEGQTKLGKRCCVFSGSGYVQAKSLHDGSKYCSWHARQARPRVQCQAITKAGARCRISSWDSHMGAQPLREGSVLCGKHANHCVRVQ